MSSNYEKRGVSFSKTDVHKAIENLNKGLEPSCFCKVIPDIFTDNEDYAIIMHADGAGTKSSLAYCYWRETGDLSVWKGIAHDALIMNIDDMMCAGADDNFIVSSTIGRNKRLIPGDVIKTIIEGFEETIEFLNKHNIKTVLSGGETADVGDLVRTIIVDATVVTRINRKNIIANNKIKAGDVIIGLASYGKSSYENFYNSGIGSNGLTSARHDIFSKILAEKYPESYDNNLPSDVVYIGKYKLTDPSPIEGIDMGKFLLSPTRTYAPILKQIFKELRNEIHGLIHCTGGANIKVLNFVEKINVVKNNLFPIPEVFKIIQQSSGVDWQEMFKVFNMGHRLEIYVSEKCAERIISIAKSFDVEAKIIGYCEESEYKKVTIKSEKGTFELTL